MVEQSFHKRQVMGSTPILDTNDSLKLYRIMYNDSSTLFLTRKRVVFEKFIKNCGRSSTG